MKIGYLALKYLKPNGNNLFHNKTLLANTFLNFFAFFISIKTAPLQPEN
jgi:hypothetical protein